MLSKKGASREEGIFIVVAGPSGVGKTTLCKALIQQIPGLKFSVSFTTRPPRPSEVNGRDYFFVSEKEFRERIKRGEFAEWAENYGFLYGTSRETMTDFLKKGCDLILDVDTHGARSLKVAYPGGIFVFILPPSLKVLKERLMSRGAEKNASLDKRFNNAVEEIKEIIWYDYAIFNDRLESAVDHLRGIYLAEKSRRERLMKKIDEFIK
jgi:guanylate kinase